MFYKEMNQELLGCNGGFNCKTYSINGGNLNPLPSLLSHLPSSSSYSIKTAGEASHAEMQSLRCPRCESSNTKFCYYNNYNLMQPRHFCKTCRRYWTKGGALRNIPIGGGRRKNKTSGQRRSSSVMTQMFHHLAFLRPHRNPNQAATSAEATMNGGSRKFDSSNKGSTMEFSSSAWRDGDQTVNGVPEFHRKLRFSPENIFSDHPSVFLSNLASSSAGSMLISTPVAGGDFSGLNPAFFCSDLPATRSAYL